MSRTNFWSSLAIGVLVLVGIPVLARNHIAFTGGARATAPAATPHAGSAGSSDTIERPFFSHGVATVEATWPTGIDGVGIRPTGNPAAETAAADLEPSRLVFYVEAESAELGSLVGVIRDARVKETCRFGSGELYTASGDAIRLALKMKAEPGSIGHAGTYRIVGGSGRFQQASGSGLVVAAIAGDAPIATATLTLSGTISY